MKPNSLKTIAFAAGLALLAPAAASAQSVWIERAHEPSVTVEAAKPFFDESGSTSTSSALALGLRLPATAKILVAAELPFAHSGWKEGAVTTRESSIGNPYLGVEVRPIAQPLRLDLGVRFPLMPADELGPALVGMFSDVERMDAYMPETWSVRAGAAYSVPLAPSIGANVRGGPLLTVAKHQVEELDRSELFATYGGEVFYQPSRLRLAGGLSGVTHLSERDTSFDDRSLHQMGLGGSYRFNRVRPGVHVGIPIDRDYREVMDWSVGLNVQVGLR